MKITTDKKKLKNTLLYFICLVFLFGCDIQSARYDRILEQASELSQQQTRESVNKLELINDPNELTEDQRVKYNILQIKLFSKIGRDISDSIFNATKLYYESINDTLLLRECLHIWALNKYRDKDYFTSLKYLDEAKELCSSFKKNRHYISIEQLRINNLFELRELREAKDIISSTLLESQKEGNKGDEASTLVILAKINSFENDIVECESNYQKIVLLSKALGYHHHQKQALNVLIELMERNEMYNQALRYLKESEELYIDRKDIPKKNLVKSMYFHKQNELDSALHYAKIASQGNDPFIASIATSYISEWFANEGDYYTAFYKKRTAIIIEDGINNNLVFKQQKEEAEKKAIESRAEVLRVEQEKRSLVFATIIMLLLLLIVIIYLFFYKKQRKHYEIYLRSKAVQLEQDNLLLQQSKEISLLREKEFLLRESLFRRIDIFKKIPSIVSTKGDEKSKKISLTENDWNELVQTIDDAYPHFTSKLKNSYPLLSTSDIRFCCFLKINVNLQDLSDIYCVSKSAITKKKYRIKTDKLLIEDRDICLDDLLKNYT